MNEYPKADDYFAMRPLNSLEKLQLRLGNNPFHPSTSNMNPPVERTDSATDLMESAVRAMCLPSVGRRTVEADDKLHFRIVGRGRTVGS